MEQNLGVILHCAKFCNEPAVVTDLPERCGNPRPIKISLKKVAETVDVADAEFPVLDVHAIDPVA